MQRPAWLALSLALSAGAALAGAPDAERAAALEHLLRQDCGACHGMTLRGGLGPALLPEQLHDHSVESLTVIILQGSPGTAMPPWNAMLSNDDARWLARRLLWGQGS